MSQPTRPIYLDHNATTPVAEEVVEAMLPALRDAWGNPSSSHAYGRTARQAIDLARGSVAELIGCSPSEIVFTGGGTESDNMALIGVAEAHVDRGRHLVISSIEHAAVGCAADALVERGWSVTRVRVNADGHVDPSAVEQALRPDTVLVSLMHSNNETGVIQPVAEVARRVRPRGVVLHCDAAQSVGKLPILVDELEVDLLTIAGHKLYAPKGIGALFVRDGVRCAPLLRGAGHEGGRRAGTENTPGIVGLGAACRLARSELEQRRTNATRLRDRLIAAIRAGCPDAVVHGERVERLPNTVSIAIPGAPGHLLAPRLAGVATAAGAACHTGVPRPSEVLQAMGVPSEIAICTLRLTLGRGTTADEIDQAAAEIVSEAGTLRAAARAAE